LYLGLSFLGLFLCSEDLLLAYSFNLARSGRFFALSGMALVLAASAIAAPGAQSRVLADSLLPVISKSKLVRPASPTDVVHLAIGLVPADLRGLEAYADAANTPGSALYRQWLTPAEIGDRYGAPAQSVAQLTNFLISKGFKIVLNPRQHMSILVDGTVSQVQDLFSTTINQYQGPDLATGRTINFRANATPVTIPGQFANLIQSVEGVENFSHPMPRANTSQLTPPLVRGLYGGQTTWNLGQHGEGMTVAISNWDGFRLAYAQTFIGGYGLPVPPGGATSNITIKTYGGGSGSGTPQGEGDLDIQMVLSSAPLANIIIYDGTTLGAVLTGESSDNLADVITESYGWSVTTDSSANTYHNLHVTMSAQGQTYMAASGDAGTHDLSWWNGSGISNGNFPYPDYDPDVLLVGGTVASVDSVTGVRASEVGWTSSGGGYYNPTLTINVLPSWQVGTGVPTTINKRLVPDISAHAQTFVVYSAPGSNPPNYYAFSGTSCSSPVFAAQLALVEQRLASANGTAKFRLGKIAPLIYKMNGRSDVWFDITSGGSSGLLANNTSAVPTAAWDFVTGWGAPKVEGLIQSFFIKGHVTLNDWVGSAAQPVTLEVRNSSNVTVQTISTTLDASGNFAFLPSENTATGAVNWPDGTYTITAKGAHWLRQGLTGIVINRGQLPQNLSFSLVNGDVNGDNVIGSPDLTAVRIAFGGTLASADMNGDGNVGSADLTIVRKNFGQSGY
jgi:subtilase family serine protease